MLEFGREIAFEIVFDDEDTEEIGIAAGAQDVPRQGGYAEGGDCGGMEEAESVSPAFCENGPEENGSGDEDDACGTFCENCEPQKKAKEN